MTTGLTTTTNFIAQKIDKNMIDSVTNAIFQRAASKAGQAVETSTNNNVYNTANYRQTVQNDVMSEARKSLQASVNPFAEGIFKSQTSQATSAANATANTNEAQQAGASAIAKNATRTTSTRARVTNSMALQNSMFTSGIRESMMIQAKDQMVNNTDLMTRLQFLNAKTAVNAYPAKQF